MRIGTKRVARAATAESDVETHRPVGRLCALATQNSTGPRVGESVLLRRRSDSFRGPAIPKAGRESVRGLSRSGVIVEGDTAELLKGCGIDIEKLLTDNDSYAALSGTDFLVLTGAKGRTKSGSGVYREMIEYLY